VEGLLQRALQGNPAVNQGLQQQLSQLQRQRHVLRQSAQLQELLPEQQEQQEEEGKKDASELTSRHRRMPRWLPLSSVDDLPSGIRHCSNRSQCPTLFFLFNFLTWGVLSALSCMVQFALLLIYLLLNSHILHPCE
jgi:hypothetical protein